MKQTLICPICEATVIYGQEVEHGVIHRDPEGERMWNERSKEEWQRQVDLIKIHILAQNFKYGTKETK